MTHPARSHTGGYLSNTLWLVLEKVLRFSVSFFVGAYLARFLGPAGYGALNYALAFAALFTVVAGLGLDSIVIRELVRHPERRDALLGTAFVMRFSGALLSLALLGGAVFCHISEPGMRALILIIGSSVLFQCFGVIELEFQAQVRSSSVVRVQLCASLAASMLKLFMIQAGAGVGAFAWAFVLESMLVACGLVLAWRRQGLFSAWRFDRGLARQLLKPAWPLALSGAAATLYLKIDQIMINRMLGNEASGQYAVALNLSEGWYFIPMALSASVFPAIIAAHAAGEAAYHATLKKFFCLMFLLALAVAFPVAFCSGAIISLVFGAAYLSASTALAIHCWASLFVFTGLISNQWYLLENLTRHTLYRQLGGALCNVLLNLFLIPRLGISGAALATLLSQIVASYLFDLLDKRSRVLFRLKLQALSELVPISLQLRRELCDACNRLRQPAAEP